MNTKKINEIKLFYNLFTKYYLDFLELNFSEKELFEIHEINKEKWLIISKWHIKNILYKIFKNHWIKLLNFNNDLIILSWWQKITFSVKNIKKQISQDIKKEEIRKKIESDKKFKISKINRIIEEWDIYKRNKKIFILEWLEEKILTKDELLEKSKEVPGFNYIDFMNHYWLSETISRTYMELFSKKVTNTKVIIEWKTIIITPEFIKTNKEAIINNFLVFNKIIVWIESEWVNQDNKNWSWAKWYFQYHTNNGVTDRKKQEYDSFETALRRNYRYLSWIDPMEMWDELLDKHPKVPDWIVDAYNHWHFDPKELWVIKQNTLFIIDMFNNGKKIRNWNRRKNWVEDYLWLVAIWNLWSVEKFYKLFHHTAPDRATKKKNEVLYQQI